MCLRERERGGPELARGAGAECSSYSHKHGPKGFLPLVINLIASSSATPVAWGQAAAFQQKKQKPEDAQHLHLTLYWLSEK